MTDYTDLIVSLKNSAFLAFDDGTNDYSSPDEAAAAITDLQAENQRLRSALEAAAQALDDYSPLTGRTIETFASRAARAALRNTETSYE